MELEKIYTYRQSRYGKRHTEKEKRLTKQGIHREGTLRPIKKHRRLQNNRFVGCTAVNDLILSGTTARAKVFFMKLIHTTKQKPWQDSSL